MFRIETVPPRKVILRGNRAMSRFVSITAVSDRRIGAAIARIAAKHSTCVIELFRNTIELCFETVQRDLTPQVMSYYGARFSIKRTAKMSIYHLRVGSRRSRLVFANFFLSAQKIIDANARFTYARH